MIVAYHGSPNEFEAFDIGRADPGQNDHGHGLYFAENWKVAEPYKRFGNFGHCKLKGAYPETPGYLYRVRILADKEHFLDWDKLLIEQSKGIQRVFAELGIGNITGQQAYDLLVLRWDQTRCIAVSNEFAVSNEACIAVSNALREAGIPGIKWLFQGWHRIFVVFDHNIVQIISRGAAAQ
jgi:hypothetical protein